MALLFAGILGSATLPPSELVAFVLWVLASYFIGGVAAFGGTVLSLVVVSMMVDMRTAVPALLLVGTVQSLQALFATGRHCDRRALSRMTVWAAIGVPIGVLTATYLNQKALGIAFAVVSILSGASRFLPAIPTQTPRFMEPVFNVLLVCSGMIHGAFAAGGAPVVVVAQHTIRERDAFRGTLFVFWVILNFTAIVSFWLTGRFTSDTMQLALYGLAPVLVATWLADHFARRISQPHFVRFVAILLIIAGLLTLVMNLRG